MITSRAWARPSSSDDKRCTPPGRVASAPRRHGLLPQQERAPGVEVEAVPPDVPTDGDVELLGERDRHLRGRRPRRDERHAHSRGLEQHLGGDAASGQEDAALGGDPAREGLALDLVHRVVAPDVLGDDEQQDRKSTRLNSSHGYISYAVFCLKKKKKTKYSMYADDGLCAQEQDNTDAVVHLTHPPNLLFTVRPNSEIR